jgi:hypothetical protein
MKLNNAQLNRIDEMMSQNIQSSNKQNVNTTIYNSRDCPENQSQGVLKGGM